MRKIDLLATALVLGAALGAADIAAAMETNSPAPPQQPQTQQPSQGHKAHTKKPKPKKNSAIDRFYAGITPPMRRSTTRQIMPAASPPCMRWATTTILTWRR